MTTATATATVSEIAARLAAKAVYVRGEAEYFALRSTWAARPAYWAGWATRYTAAADRLETAARVSRHLAARAG